jgi:hypothetical protein
MEAQLHVQTMNSFCIQDSLIFIITLFYNLLHLHQGLFLASFFRCSSTNDNSSCHKF